MPELEDECSTMIHSIPVPSDQKSDCCSISEQGYDKNIIVSENDSHILLEYKDSYKIQFIEKTIIGRIADRTLLYVFPPPLKTIKFLR